MSSSPLVLAANLYISLPYSAGWPGIRGTYLARPNAAGIWEAQPIEPSGPSPPVAPGMEEAQTPEDVAGVDPLAGLMQMQVWGIWAYPADRLGSGRHQKRAMRVRDRKKGQRTHTKTVPLRVKSPLDEVVLLLQRSLPRPSADPAAAAVHPRGIPPPGCRTVGASCAHCRWPLRRSFCTRHRKVSASDGYMHMLVTGTAAVTMVLPSLLLCRCPRLLEVLKSMLKPASLLDEEETSDGGQAGSASPTDPSHPLPATSGGSREGDAALQAPLLLLLRTLCQSSQLAAQLVKSAGVLPLVQAHLLLGCSSSSAEACITGGAAAVPASSAGGQSRGSAVVLCQTMPGRQGGDARHTLDAAGNHDGGSLAMLRQLCVLEALRLWRVCCHQCVVGLPALEDVFSPLCHLLLPPVESGDGDTSQLKQPHGRRQGAMVLALRWHVCREAHLLVAALMAHAAQAAGKDRSLGRPLLLPGTAAAVAQDALQWLQRPEGIRAVAATLVEKAGGAEKSALGLLTG